MWIQDSPPSAATCVGHPWCPDIWPQWCEEARCSWRHKHKRETPKHIWSNVNAHVCVHVQTQQQKQQLEAKTNILLKLFLLFDAAYASVWTRQISCSMHDSAICWQPPSPPELLEIAKRKEVMEDGFHPEADEGQLRWWPARRWTPSRL